MAGLFGSGSTKVAPPQPVKEPSPMPDPEGKKTKIEARKKAVRRNKSRSGRKSTILSQDDKSGDKS